MEREAVNENRGQDYRGIDGAEMPGKRPRRGTIEHRRIEKHLAELISWLQLVPRCSDSQSQQRFSENAAAVASQPSVY